MTALGVCPRLLRAGRMAADLIGREFGVVTVSARGILPQKSPERPRSVAVPNRILISYLGQSDASCEPALPENFPLGCERGLLWLPDRLGVWARAEDRSYYLNAVSDRMHWREVGSFAGQEMLIPALLKAPPFPLQSLGNDSFRVSPEGLRAAVELTLMTGVPVSIYVMSLAQVVLYIAMFSVVFGLMSRGRPRHLTARQVTVLAVYAGFPAILLGSLATALSLPWLDFNLVYVLGMTGYLMVVMNRLDRDRQRLRQDKL